MRIAYFSPLKPIKSGISGYSEGLLPELARFCDIDVFVDGYAPSSPSITARFVVNDASRSTVWRGGRYDLAVYHMGNNPYHAYMYRALRERPGVTVLHDAVLHHLVVEETLAKGDIASYVREMSYAYGREGVKTAYAVIRGDAAIPHFGYPLNHRVVELSHGVIVHNEYARGLVNRASPAARVGVVPLYSVPRGEPDTARRESARTRLGIEPTHLVLASFGFATPSKRVEASLRAFSRLLELHPDSRFVWVGENPDWHDVPALIRSLGLEGRARVTGYVDDGEFEDYIRAADVCLGLRHPTAGESSAALLDLMGMGKATIVSNTGWFSELPSDCCIKVDIGPNEEDELVCALQRLAEDDDLRAHMGQDARQYVLENHRLEDTARGYAEFMEQVYQEVSRG